MYYKPVNSPGRLSLPPREPSHKPQWPSDSAQQEGTDQHHSTSFPLLHTQTPLRQAQKSKPEPSLQGFLEKRHICAQNGLFTLKVTYMVLRTFQTADSTTPHMCHCSTFLLDACLPLHALFQPVLPLTLCCGRLSLTGIIFSAIARRSLSLG